MTREELRKHCHEELTWYKDRPESKRYQEHLLILSLLNQTEWTPVSERLPEEGKQYLCCDQNGFIEVGYYRVITHDWQFADNAYMDEVVKWMPFSRP